MKKNLKNACAKTLSVVLALGMVASVSPAASADAASKKPKLSATKVTVKKGKTKKVTVKIGKKNAKAKQLKKVSWSLTKKGKKIVKLTKKSKTGITIKGLKKGTATITAKITLKGKKKAVTKKVKVTVKNSSTAAKKTPATTTAAAATSSAAAATSSAAAATSSATAATQTPAATTGAPSESGTPAESNAPETSNTPAEESDVWEGPSVKLTSDYIYTSADREANYALTDPEELDDTYGFKADGSVKYKDLKGGYNGGIVFKLDKGENAYDLDAKGYKYVVIDFENEVEGEIGLKMLCDAQAANIWGTRVDCYGDSVKGGYGDAFKAPGRHTIVFDVSTADLTSISGLFIPAKEANQVLTLYSVTFAKEVPEGYNPGGSSDENTSGGAITSGGAVDEDTTGSAIEAFTISLKDATVEAQKKYWNPTKEGGAGFSYGGFSSDVVTSIEGGIKITGCHQVKINFASILADNDIDLSKYSKLTMTVKAFDNDGNEMAAPDNGVYEDHGLCTLDGLNGYDGSDIAGLSSYYAINAAAVIDLTKATNKDDLKNVAGMNVALDNIAKMGTDGAETNYAYMTISNIVLS